MILHPTNLVQLCGVVDKNILKDMLRQAVISMTSYVHLQPSVRISACDRAISSVISPNQSHLTSRPYLRVSVSSVHSDYDMLYSTLVLVLLCRYLHAVCTTPAFVPPVCSSGYCTFCSLSYSSAPPPLLMLCFSIVYKLLDNSAVQ